LSAWFTTYGHNVETVVEPTSTPQDDSALLRMALETAPLGVVVSDGSGEPVFTNAAARQFIEGRHAETIVQSAVLALLERASDGGEPADTVTEELDLYGPPRWNLVLQARRLDDGAVVTIEDATERRRLEEIRRDFVANITHELKTPLGALGVLAETMEDEPDPEVVRRLADRIQHEAFRVGRLIDDLLELSRIEGAYRFDEERVPVGSIVDEAVELVRPAADRAHIDIKVVESTGDAVVVGDRRQLVSALANLVENAVKYSDAGSQVEVRFTQDRDPIEIEVEDRGIGIPARDLDRIFERFYRVDRARARSTGGTGLGLAIVRHVVTNHGGTVNVRSHEGDGSTFTLVLPASTGETTPGDPTDTGDPHS
jgi:two-component system sensor histidine kinase SenX3